MNDTLYVSDFRFLHYHYGDDHTRNPWKQFADRCTPVVLTYAFYEPDALGALTQTHQTEFRTAITVFEAEFGLRFLEVESSAQAMITVLGSGQERDLMSSGTSAPDDPDYLFGFFDDLDYSQASDNYDTLLLEIMGGLGLAARIESHLNYIRFYQPTEAHNNTDYTLFSDNVGTNTEPKDIGIMDRQALNYAFGDAQAMKGWQVFQMGDTEVGIRGSKRDDTIMGTGFDTQIWGRDGHDRIFGREDADTLYGGAGRDMLQGHGGDDVLKGGGWNDVLYGDNGDPSFYAFHYLSSQDRLSGQNGHDILYGGWDDDVLLGGRGQDHLDGGANDDRLGGGNGRDTLLGGEGNDTLRGAGGADRLNGGAGNDRLFGGRDGDIFIFETDALGGRDTILDFELGVDSVDFASLLDVDHGLRYTIVGHAVRIDYTSAAGDLRIDINGLAPAELIYGAFANFDGLFGGL